MALKRTAISTPKLCAFCSLEQFAECLDKLLQKRGLMTRKDYILIADALQKFGTQTSVHVSTAAQTAAVYIADALESENPRFDREHFLAVVRGEKSLTLRPTRKDMREIQERIDAATHWAND